MCRRRSSLAARGDRASQGSRTAAEIGARVLRTIRATSWITTHCCRSSRTRSIFRFRWSKSSRACYALELFHGPTLAFKDIGARVMARLMAALYAATRR